MINNNNNNNFIEVTILDGRHCNTMIAFFF